MLIHHRKKPPTPSIVFDTYWRFAAERQSIFFNRIENESGPWTTDPILSVHRFTNAYRAADRVSQYLIRNVQYKGNPDFREVFFRTLLFKIFNKIETWELLEAELGEVNSVSFSTERYGKILHDAVKAKETLYSGAYIMASGKSAFGYDRKFENHLHLLAKTLRENLPEKIAGSKTLESVFHHLRDLPSLGNFLAFQYCIDLNYSAHLPFSEMDFVVPGPGAKDGIRKCFISPGDYSENDIIHWVTERQDLEFERLNLNFKTLWGRPLQLIDCQNLFCEVDKYARLAHPEITGLSGRKRIKQKFAPKKEKVDFWFPPKWGVDNQIKYAQECIYQSLPQE